MEEEEEVRGGEAVLLDFTASFKNGADQQQQQQQQQQVKPWMRRRQRAPSGKEEACAAGEGREAACSSPEAAGDKENGALGDALQSFLEPASPQPGDGPEARRPDVGLAAINCKLEQLGYEQLREDDMGAVVEVIQGLLVDIEAGSTSLKSYETAAHRSEVARKRLRERVDALELQVQMLQQDVANANSRASMVADKAKKDKKAFEAWLKERDVKIARMEGQQKNWQATLNRKESEYERLQKRMQMLQAQRDRSIKRGIEMELPPPPRAFPPGFEDDSPADADGAEPQDQAPAANLDRLHAAASDSLQHKLLHLRNENDKLRASLQSVQGVLLSKLQLVFEARGKHEATGPSEADELRLQDGCFRLPAEELERLMEELGQRVEALLESAPELSQPDGDDAPSSEAEAKLKEAYAVITTQDKLIKMSLFGEPVDRQQPASSPDDTALEKDIQQLRAQRFDQADSVDLESEKAQLAAEWSKLTEERRRLGLARVQLDQDRLAAFERGEAPSDDAAAAAPGTPLPPSVRRLRAEAGCAPGTPAAVRDAIEALPVPPTPETKRLLKEIL